MALEKAMLVCLSVVQAVHHFGPDLDDIFYKQSQFPGGSNLMIYFL